MFKERKRFLGCPVYLTNMGLGLVMILALAIAGAVFRKKVLEFFNLIPGLSLLMPLLICAVLGFLVSSTCISTPLGVPGGQIHLDSQVPAPGPPADSPGKAAVPQCPGSPHSHGLRSDFVPGLRLWAGRYAPGDGISRPSGPAVRPPWAWSAASSGPVWIG